MNREPFFFDRERAIPDPHEATLTPSEILRRWQPYELPIEELALLARVKTHLFLAFLAGAGALEPWTLARIERALIETEEIERAFRPLDRDRKLAEARMKRDPEHPAPKGHEKSRFCARKD